MDFLDELLKVSPKTWTQVPKCSYEDSYYSELLSTTSQEYRKVAQEFEPYCSVKYIKRVQNPFQFGLFHLAKEKKTDESDHCRVVRGYHVIYEKDLDTALKYTVDYRRYKHTHGLIGRQYVYEVKEPKFYENVMDAVNAFTNCAYVTHDQSKLVLVCDILSESYYEIKTSSQADYQVHYVVCIE